MAKILDKDTKYYEDKTYNDQFVDVMNQEGGSGGKSKLSELNDVNIDSTTLVNDQVLKYDSTNSKWVNATDSSNIHNTGDLPLASSTESVSGTKTYQNEVNLEVVEELKNSFKQYKVLPTNYSQYNGVIAFYTGSTTSEYEQYQYYRCDGTGWNKFSIVGVKTVKLESLDTTLSSRIYEVTIDTSDPNILNLKSLS